MPEVRSSAKVDSLFFRLSNGKTSRLGPYGPPLCNTAVPNCWINLIITSVSILGTMLALMVSCQRQYLEGLCHGYKWLHLFVDFEACYEQMGPIPSSNRSSDIAQSNAHTESPRRRTFRPSMPQNWPRDRKLTELLVFALISRLTRCCLENPLAVEQVYIEKMFNRNIEIGFQSAIFHLCQGALVPLLWNDRGPNAMASI